MQLGSVLSGYILQLLIWRCGSRTAVKSFVVMVAFVIWHGGRLQEVAVLVPDGDRSGYGQRLQLLLVVITVACAYWYIPLCSSVAAA